MSRSHVPDPLETALSWVWALGTAAGLAMVGLLAHTEHSSAQVPVGADDAQRRGRSVGRRRRIGTPARPCLSTGARSEPHRVLAAGRSRRPAGVPAPHHQ